MKKTYLLRCGVLVFAILLAPHIARADLITGGAGSTVTDNGPNGGRDDTNIATTIDAIYQTFCSWLIDGMQNQFPGVNFTFASSGSNIGSLFAQSTFQHVLYGGVQWGFSYSNSDPQAPPSVPEPSSVWLVGGALIAMFPRLSHILAPKRRARLFLRRNLRISGHPVGDAGEYAARVGGHVERTTFDRMTRRVLCMSSFS